jgi:hypothetical protein
MVLFIFIIIIIIIMVIIIKLVVFIIIIIIVIIIMEDFVIRQQVCRILNLNHQVVFINLELVEH